MKEDVVEIYYQTKLECVRGLLTLKADHMAFASVLGDIQFCVDYLDLASVQKVSPLNKLVVDHSDSFIRENYRYNWML